MSHSPHEMMLLLIVPSFPSFCASEGKMGSHGCSYGVYPWRSSDSLWWFFFWLTSLFKCAWSLPIWLYLYIALFVTDSPAHATERKTFPWTHSLLPGAAIRHRQLRVAYLETAESCWQAVRSPPVLVIFTEIPVARVMVLYCVTVSRYLSAEGSEFIAVYTGTHSGALQELIQGFGTEFSRT